MLMDVGDSRVVFLVLFFSLAELVLASAVQSCLDRWFIGVRKLTRCLRSIKLIVAFVVIHSISNLFQSTELIFLRGGEYLIH